MPPFLLFQINQHAHPVTFLQLTLAIKTHTQTIRRTDNLANWSFRYQLSADIKSAIRPSPPSPKTASPLDKTRSLHLSANCNSPAYDWLSKLNIHYLQKILRQVCFE
jgi:hypothetical protein